VDKGPVQVWLTSVFSLLAAIVGGWIAGRYAVHAQKHAAKEWDRLSRGTGPEPGQAQGMDLGLRKWANETIRERLEVVEKRLPGLLKDIEKYLVNG
jgi:hypothetical protein